jgi:hypothetical protein
MTVDGYFMYLCVRGIDCGLSLHFFLLDFETVIFLFIKELLDNVLSIVVELCVSLQVKLGSS